MNECGSMSERNEFALKYTPVELKTFYVTYRGISEITFVSKQRMRNGLLLFYPYKRYSIPPKLRVLLHPDLLKNVKVDFTEFCEREDEDAKRNVEFYHGKPTYRPHVGRWCMQAIEARLDGLKAVTAVKRDGSIIMLPPRRDTEFKYVLVIAAFESKHTAHGATAGGRVEGGKLLYHTDNVSRGGTHWVYYEVVIARRGEAKLVWKWWGPRKLVDVREIPIA